MTYKVSHLLKKEDINGMEQHDTGINGGDKGMNDLIQKNVLE